jgi:prevent-host-death family protein
MPRTLEKPKTRIVNMHEAKTNLSKLVEAVENGENIVIARNGKPAVQLTRLEQKASTWSVKMLNHLKKRNPNAHLEPDPFPRIQENDDFRDPFEEKEPHQ